MVDKAEGGGIIPSLLLLTYLVLPVVSTTSSSDMTCLEV